MLADLEERRAQDRRDAGPVAGRLQHRVREHLAFAHQTGRRATRRLRVSLADRPRADATPLEFATQLLQVRSSLTEEALQKLRSI